MQNRNPFVLASALLIVVLTFVLAAIIVGETKKPTRIVGRDAVSTAEAINRRNSTIKRVYCPTIKMGITSSSSLFCERGGDMLFSTKVFGIKEALVGCKGSEYWFWMRSFDRNSVYFCERSEVEKTRLRPLMRPEVISMIAWFCEIDVSSKITPSQRGFVSESIGSGLVSLIEFDSEKIISQKVSHEGTEIVTMEGDDYAPFSGYMMPKKIILTWHEENLSSNFYVKDWKINGERLDSSAPNGLKRIRLEAAASDYSSSSGIPVSFSFSPILDGHQTLAPRKAR